ncbi:hypothetical protein [Paraeggerthella sp. Marseille-Q4926]|uniref:hypothetical protein n=1 Tax=Paraeggerthella sp. Marseille-Q4926 TaxID=2866587 RepID=UPI001CE45D9A|nr:hypothetical protein [Paraeggerthella sp. Marseille-Q4926]
MLVDLLRLLAIQALLRISNRFDRYLSEAFRGDDAQFETVVLEFFLQSGGEVVVALVRDDGKHVRLWVAQSLAVLARAQTQTAPGLLALGQGVFGLHQRADLEDVGIVPDFLRSGMAEDERYVLVLVRVLFIRKEMSVSFFCMMSSKAPSSSLMPADPLESLNSPFSPFAK